MSSVHPSLLPQNEPIDELADIQALLGEDFKEIAELFLRDSPARLQTLHDASLDGDSAALARAAHVLCGSSSSIGATGLSRLCRDMEIAAKNQQLDHGVEQVLQIETEYARIEDRLRTLTATS